MFITQIHRFLIYHLYSTAISCCNFLKASLKYEEHILLVAKDFKLGRGTIKLFFNILFVFLKYNTRKKNICVWHNFWPFTYLINTYFNLPKLSVKSLVPAWKIILSILRFSLKLASISLSIMWLVVSK